MNSIINTAAALHLDNTSKEAARETCNQAKIVQNERVKCNCSDYKSPFNDCPNCGPEYWEEQVEQKHYMNNKNYKIKLTVTAPDTDKHLNASVDLNVIQDMKAMNGISMLDEMLHVLVDEFENAEFNEARIEKLKNDRDKTLHIKKALDDLNTEYPDKESVEFKTKRREILQSL